MAIFYKAFKKGFLRGVSQLRITSDFGKRMMNGKIETHYGIDIGVPAGTTLEAPLDGKIISRQVGEGAGLYVTIQHQVSPGLYIYILLMHLKSVESYINVGYRIKEGEKIGLTGGTVGHKNSGRSTGPHLHLEVRKGGNKHANAIDPKRWFLSREDYVEVATGKVTKGGNYAAVFKEEELVYISNKRYSPADDITINNETEQKTSSVKKRVPTEAKERLAPGIWQITKLLLDSSVQDKQVVDSSISIQQGSLLNFFRKVCQEHLVEFSGDTFGNQYYWIVKRPPFDKVGFEKMIDLTSIVLTDDDVENSNLSWNDEGIYSWYQYIPYAELIEVQEVNYYIPAIFFPEYAAVWGSRPLSVQSNYYNRIFSGDTESDRADNEGNVNNVMKNAIRDLKFLIESNAYNPFTRRGTITIRGDRRIKRGTVIMHTSGEIFYVDAVTNQYNVTLSGATRTTTLTVSKGMYPEYIYGKEIDGKVMSYFNIIDFGGYEADKINNDNWRKIISNWKVNLDSFGFFMSKQQVFREQILKDEMK